MKQQELNGTGEVSPTDRSDKNNGWIDWVVSARSDDPAQLASALEEVGGSDPFLSAHAAIPVVVVSACFSRWFQRPAL